MFSKLKHIQELRSQANQIKKALAESSVEGSGAGGKVIMIMDGNQDVQSVAIDPSLLTDQKRVEQGVREATNDAIKKAQRVMAQKMQSMGNIPGLS